MGRKAKCAIGTKLRFDGEEHVVVGIDGPVIRLRGPNGRLSVIAARELLADPGYQILDGWNEEENADWSAAELDSLPNAVREQAKRDAEHVLEALTGYASGDSALARPGEPKEKYDPDAVGLTERIGAKAGELGVSRTTMWDKKRRFEAGGATALADKRRIPSGAPRRVDPRLCAAMIAAMSEVERRSNVSKKRVLRRAKTIVQEEYGEGVVPIPSTSTLYRELDDLDAGRGTFGTAKRRRENADRPKGSYLSMAATRPGEVIVMDTTPLDVLAIDPHTGALLSYDLSLAMDLFTRSILAWRFTPKGTNATDASLLLADVIAPKRMRPGWPDTARWAYHGVPEKIVLGAFGGESVAALPVLDPDTIVVDNGKIYVSEQFTEACRVLGISVHPARLYRATDKAQIERNFRTVRESLLENMPGYKGPDVASRGERVEEEAVYFVDEIEDYFAEWVVRYWQENEHGGLHAPGAPGANITPNQMYNIGIATAGFLYVPPNPNLYFELLPIEWRTIQRYGVEIDRLIYRGDALVPYRNKKSPYGGRAAGKWPIRVDPRDLNRVYFRDPDDGEWHEIPWAHAPPENLPLNATLLRESKKLLLARMGRPGRSEEVEGVLHEILQRVERDRVLHPRERRAVVKALIHREQAAKDRGENDKEARGGVEDWDEVDVNVRPVGDGGLDLASLGTYPMFGQEEDAYGEAVDGAGPG